MPTLGPTQPASAPFDAVYPEDLGERLGWFARELGVSEGRLLGLLDLTPADVAALPTGGVAWDAVVAVHESAAWWAERILYDTLALFDYDAGALRQYLSRPASADYPVPRPGGHSVRAATLPPQERDRTLRVLLAADGPQARQALLAYLAQPDEPATSLS
jgi:hypothetical protein